MTANASYRGVSRARGQLRLVLPEPDAPKLGARRLTWMERMAAEGFTDEIQSVQSAGGMLVERGFASADAADPWDFGGDAA